MGKGEQKVYMPVMIGDWLKGTRGMRADMKGVYMGLLLHQWEHGFIPADVYELELIEPEVNKVWDKLKHKFEEFSPGKLRNKKAEDVRDFWQKQRKNGQQGGRPKKDKPKPNPNHNPEANPNGNHHNDLDLDNDPVLEKQKESENFDAEVPRGTKPEEVYFQPDIEGDEIIFPLDGTPMRDVWARWKKYRWHQHGFTYGMMGEQAALKKLEGMDFQQIEKTILNAIEAKWQNLYPDGKNGKQPQQTRTQRNTSDLAAGFAARHGPNADQ